jgi:hypothetical protein
MPAPQLSVRSARARDLAHMLAKRERRTVAQVVELALEAYARPEVERRLTGAEFVAKLLERDPKDAIDIDIEAMIDEHRRPHRGIDLE